MRGPADAEHASAACETLPLVRDSTRRRAARSASTRSAPPSLRSSCSASDAGSPGRYARIVELQRQPRRAGRAEHEVVLVDGQQRRGRIAAGRHHNDTGSRGKALRKRLVSMRSAASRTACDRMASAISLTSSRQVEISSAAGELAAMVADRRGGAAEPDVGREKMLVAEDGDRHARRQSPCRCRWCRRSPRSRRRRARARARENPCRRRRHRAARARRRCDRSTAIRRHRKKYIIFFFFFFKKKKKKNTKYKTCVTLCWPWPSNRLIACRLLHSEHRAAIERQGVSPLHRMSFQSVAYTQLAL